MCRLGGRQGLMEDAILLHYGKVNFSAAWRIVLNSDLAYLCLLWVLKLWWNGNIKLKVNSAFYWYSYLNRFLRGFLLKLKFECSSESLSMSEAASGGPSDKQSLGQFSEPLIEGRVWRNVLRSISKISNFTRKQKIFFIFSQAGR